MKKSLITSALLGAVLAVGSVATTTALADSKRGARMYQVVVTNGTLGQPLAPSVIATHNDSFRMFELGEAPSAGDTGYDRYFALATLAETGYPILLRDEVAAADGVWAAEALATDRMPPVLLPGESNSLVISASRGTRYLSAAAMLGATNDAFYAVRNLRLPRGIGDSVRVNASAYDAGSEANAESADSIGALGASDDNPMTGDGINVNGEGYIHVHAGIHGVGGPGGLAPSVHDWRNPVAELTITRVK